MKNKERLWVLRGKCLRLLDITMKEPPPTGGINSGTPSAPGLLSFMVVRSLVGAGWLLWKSITAGDLSSGMPNAPESFSLIADGHL